MGSDGVLAFINKHQWRFNIHRFIYIDAITCNEKANLIQITSSKVFIFIYFILFIFLFKVNN